MLSNPPLAISREFLRSGIIGLAAAAALHAAIPVAAVAQPPVRRGGPNMNSTMPDPGAQPESRISLNFPGGTVAQFCKAVQQASEPRPINIVVSKDAAEVALPPVEYKEVSVDSALEALPMAAYSESARYQLRVQAVGQASDGSGVYSISATPVNNQMPNMPQGYPGMPPMIRTPQRVETYSIRDLIDPPSGQPGVPIDTVLTALDTAIALDPDAKSAGSQGGAGPEVKFHKESGMLIVRGDQDQLRTVKDLLKSLREDVGGREHLAAAMDNEREERARRRIDLEHSLAKAKLQMDIRQRELEIAKAARERSKELLAAGTLSADEAAKLELDLARKQAEMQAAALDVDTVMQRATMEEQSSAKLDPLAGVPARATGGEPAVVVVYDVRDLRPFLPDVTATISSIALGDGAPARSSVSQVGDAAGSLAVTTTTSRHRAIISALNLLRKTKANDPKAPGLNADDLLKNATPPKD